MPSTQLSKPWKPFLSEIDAAVNQTIHFECLGGFVVTTLYGLERPTADVDVLSIVPGDQRDFIVKLAGQGSPLHKKHGVYLEVVTVAAVPEGYEQREQRLTLMFEGVFQHLRLFALDPYDLALSKLERNIQRDRDDVKHLARTVPFDLGILKRRYEKELRPNLGNPQREDLTLNLWIEAIEEERAQNNRAHTRPRQ
jgi:hypothetical protein